MQTQSVWDRLLTTSVELIRSDLSVATTMSTEASPVAAKRES